MFVSFSFFGRFGGGCIDIVHLESLFWHLFFNKSFSLPIYKKNTLSFVIRGLYRFERPSNGGTEDAYFLFNKM